MIELAEFVLCGLGVWALWGIYGALDSIADTLREVIEAADAE